MGAEEIAPGEDPHRTGRRITFDHEQSTDVLVHQVIPASRSVLSGNTTTGTR